MPENSNLHKLQNILSTSETGSKSGERYPTNAHKQFLLCILQQMATPDEQLPIPT
jgi:hypothetical protein